MRSLLTTIAMTLAAPACGGAGGGTPATTSTATATAAAAGAPAFAQLSAIMTSAVPCGAIAAQPAAFQGLLTASYAKTSQWPDGSTYYVINTSDGYEIQFDVGAGDLKFANYVTPGSGPGTGKEVAYFPACN